MTDEVSAGVIVFRETRDKREYLLLKNRNGDWEFPKGGIEGDEELQQAALRELEEETGLEKVKLLNGFREDYSYEFYTSNGRVYKTVHLFIGKSFETNVNLSSEHQDLQWRDYEQALNTTSHDGPEEILREADAFLDSHPESEINQTV